ncbi:S-layer homology domain-containing protein [Sporosarcina sp. BP05]|uniref:S-layer homology domain-containing protein n=1 Tax=Sporosarcina sp. BP05 TaxID=2758726 RepID=UPI0016442FC6|nr:S-layer homology domain-containing protein [Sporosarcina sp. BP05]
MKKNSSRKAGFFLLCMIMIFSLLPAIPASVFAEDTGISVGVVNPGFEMPLDADGAIPGWIPENAAPGISISPSVFNNGSQSLHFKDGSDKSGLRVLSDKVAVIPGKAYLSKVMINVVNQTHNIVSEVRYYDGNNKVISDKIKVELFGNLPRNQWTELKVFTDVPTNASYARLAFYSGGISLTEAYFDDVTLELAEEDKLLERDYNNPTKLGEMVQVQLGQASVIQENKMGENEVYYHSNGLPGTFSVIDAETGKLKFSEVIKGTEALWAMTVGPDKNVYFAGTGDGKLYRYVPELKKIEELGVNPSDDWVWDLEATADGKIYGSTYPHASVFEYDIATGKFRDYGNVKAGQQYARGIAVTDEHIYVGIGTTKHLFKVDRVTGEKEEVILEGHSGEDGMIENIFVVNDMLFVSVGSITMLVIDPKTNEVIHTFQYSNMISEPSPHNANLIYYKFKNLLYQYDFSVNQSTLIEGIPLLPDTVRVKDMEWITLTSGETVLAMVTQYGEFMYYEPINNDMKFVKLDISSQAVAIQALETGHDGKLYMGGYQRGMSIYNPFEKELEVSIPSFAQPEGIGFLNGKVFYGTYVGAMMYSYDPLKDVDLNSNPQFEYDITDQQDRPFAITSGDDKLFVGTVPDYGILGGVLAIYDEKTNKWSQHRNIVQDQSIIALAYKDGKLYGGTSVWGGLGADPKAKEAKIFVWDVETGEKIEEFTPTIPGIDETPRMIGGLSFGPDGNLWGAVDGTIFVMDPVTKEIVKSKVIRPSLYNSSKWFPYRLQWAPDGMLYTTLSRKLIAIDPETLAYQVLVEDFMNNMSLGVDGSIYYALGSNLHKIAIPETDATLSSITADGKLLSDFSPGLTKYTISSTHKMMLVAEANVAGAQIDIVDSEDSTTIKVTATDGKSMLEYKIDWKIEIEKPEYGSTGGGDTTTPTPVEPGKVVVVVDEKDVANQVNDSKTKNVEVTVPAPTEATPEVKVEVSAATLKAIADSAKPLVVKAGDMEVSVPSEVLKSISQSVPGNVTISVGLVKNSETPGNGTSVSAVYEFTISVEKDGKTSNVTTFTQPVVISIPVDASKVKDGRKVAAYYVNEKTNAVEYMGGKLANGKVEFKTKHFSKFVIVENDKTFTDIQKYWAQNEIEVLASRSIIAGKTDTTFNPGGDITRAEFAVLIARALNLPTANYKGTFKDVTQSKAWAYAGVEAAFEAGIVKGKSADHFDPDALITREEIATMIIRAVEYQDASLVAGLDVSKTFADDAKIGAFAKASVANAAALGIVMGGSDNNFKPKSNATRAESAVMLYRVLQKLNEF